MGARFHVHNESTLDVADASLNLDKLDDGDVLLKLFSNNLALSAEAFALVIVNLPNHSGFKSSDSCCSSTWTSVLKRMVLINIGLGPSRQCEYGPLSGPGYVAPNKQFPSSTSSVDSTTYSQLGALCHRATTHLIAPPLDNHNPARQWISRIRLVQIPLDATARADGDLAKQISAMISTVDGELNFSDEIATDCAYCHLALALARNDGDSNSHYNTSVLWALLRPEMAKSDDEFTVLALTLPENAVKQTNVVVFPNGALLLRSGASLERDLSCKGQSLRNDGELSRHVFAAILRGVYAVAPTHLRWSAARETFVEDYLFAVGHTPFGPLSSSVQLSKPIQDSVRRNPIVKHLSDTLDMLNRAKRRLSSGEIRDLDVIVEGEKAVRRSAVLIGLFDFENAIIYAAAARTSVRWLENLIKDRGLVEAVIDCPSNGGGEWIALPVIGAFIFGFAYDAWIVNKDRKIASQTVSGMVGGLSTVNKVVNKKQN